MQLNVKRIHPNAKLPTYATVGAACFDICTYDGGTITAGMGAIFPTGLSFEIPKGFVLLIFSRSGMGFKHDIRLSNCVGVIDSDYRGELMVKLYADFEDYEVYPGDRIAQGMLVPIPSVEFKEVEELNNTDRGNGGLGSTGS